MFPLKTLRKVEKTPIITYTLIAINALVFFWELSLSQSELSLRFQAMAIVPCEMHKNYLSVETLLDSLRTMFLHGGWLHIIGNMLFLYLFGPHIEDYLGRSRFLGFYLIAGFMAGLLHTAVNWNSCVPAIGASGAIYGILGGFFLVYPATRVRTVAFFYRVPVGLVDVQAFYMLFYYFTLDFINGLTALGVDNTGTGGVAVWAHVGGFLAGVLLTFIMTIFKPPPPVDPFGYMDHQ